MPEPSILTQPNPSGLTSSNNWIERIPDEPFKQGDGSEVSLRKHPSLQKFVKDGDLDVGGLFKSYANMESMSGRSLRVPGDDAKPEEWDAFYEKLGRPKSADEYKFERGNLPEGFQYPEEAEKSFLQAAHKGGLSTKQAGAVLSWFKEFAGGNFLATQKAKAEAQSKATEELMKEWGQDYDANLKLAQRGLMNYAKDENDPLAKWLKESGNHTNPVLIRFFAKLAKDQSEHTAKVDGENNGDRGAASAESAKAEIASIRNDKDHPFHDSRKAGHKEALAKMEELYKIAYSV